MDFGLDLLGRLNAVFDDYVNALFQLSFEDGVIRSGGLHATNRQCTGAQGTTVDPDLVEHNDRWRNGTLVLQGSGVTNTFVNEVLPRIDEAGLNMNIFYVASAELFDLLPSQIVNAALVAVS